MSRLFSKIIFFEYKWPKKNKKDKQGRNSAVVAAIFLIYEHEEGLVWSTFKVDKEKQKELMWIDLKKSHVKSKMVLHQKLKDKIRKLRMRRGVKP
jgi:hypothetical protein